MRYLKEVADKKVPKNGSKICHPRIRGRHPTIVPHLSVIRSSTLPTSKRRNPQRNRLSQTTILILGLDPPKVTQASQHLKPILTPDLINQMRRRLNPLETSFGRVGLVLKPFKPKGYQNPPAHPKSYLLNFLSPSLSTKQLIFPNRHRGLRTHTKVQERRPVVTTFPTDRRKLPQNPLERHAEETTVEGTKHR